MKKIIKSAFVLAIMALTFTSCEDVPAPFDTDYHEQGGTSNIEPAGEGTEASPYNVARVLEIIKAGEYTSDMVYLKGVITKIKEIDTGTFGNATYSINDTKEDRNSFLIYRGYGLGGEKFSTGNEIAVGDTVVVYGELINYNGTPETKQGSKIISINGKTGGNTGGETGGEDIKPAGEGTEASPYNVAKALELTNALPKDETSEKEVYVAGTIVGTPSIDTGTYGNATYDISDDGSSTVTFKIFRGYAFNGEKFTAADQLKAGDKVIVYGKLLNYFGNTPEMAQGNRLISVNGKTEFENTGGESGGNENPGGETPNGLTIEGTTVTAVNSDVTAGTTTATIDLGTLDLEKGAEVTTVNLSDGSTVTFGAGTNNRNKPVFYPATKGVRVYANNEIKFACKSKIAKIVFTCDSYNSTDYVGNATQTMVFDGNNATYTNAHTAASGGVQLRVQTITITYAE
ncbi:MAG: hypothetical protein ACOYJK_11060 [Prevotella sp.]|jgi:hypothetical protein